MSQSYDRDSVSLDSLQKADDTLDCEVAVGRLWIRQFDIKSHSEALGGSLRSIDFCREG